MTSRCLLSTGLFAASLSLASTLSAQQFIKLPAPQISTSVSGQQFDFASDGPTGPGWTRPDLIARVYVHENLPALFCRTIRLNSDVPQHVKLSWIFTGPRAGVTVELTNSTVTLMQRSYDSMALYQSGNYPEKITRDKEIHYSGDARDLTVIVDAHLSVSVLLNGKTMVVQPLTVDLLHHQLMFSGPRNKHLTLSGTILPQVPQSAVIRAFPSKLHQTMIGFGGSPSIPAYEALSEKGKQMYWDLLRHYNLLMDREYPMGTELKPDLSNVDDLRDATPHYYGDNFPNGEVSDFHYMHHIRELGGHVLYELWALPTWATEPYTPKGKPIIDAWGKPVTKMANPSIYAEIIVGFCRKAKEESGAAPEIVGIQNEVEQPPEVYAAMTIAVRKALDAAGFTSTKIQMADAPYAWIALRRIAHEKHYPQAWAYTDFTASHQYDFQQFLANPDLYDDRLTALHRASDGKPFLATEICLNDPAFQEPSYRLALQVGQLYQKDLVYADAEMLLYCWLILDVEQPTFGSSRSLLVPDLSNGDIPIASSFQLRVLGAYSRHVLEGMRRVETSSDNHDLLTSAFTDGKHTSMIVLNRSTAEQNLQIDWPGVRWTQIERTSFYSDNVQTAAPKDILVEPGEIVTLSNFNAEGTTRDRK